MDAVQRYIDSPETKWPTPGVILALTKDDVSWLRRQVELDASRRLEAPGEPLEPPFEPTAEELARVSAACAKWRKEFAPVVTDRFYEWPPASQGGASDELKALVAKQRSREHA